MVVAVAIGTVTAALRSFAKPKSSRRAPLLVSMMLAGQRLAFQVLHHEEGGAALVADVEERADVRVIELRNGLRFAVEALAELRVGGQRAGKGFDRNGAIQPRIERLVNLAHAAGAQLGDDFIGAEAGAGGQRQVVTGNYMCDVQINPLFDGTELVLAGPSCGPAGVSSKN
jgi:hypothetical protein